MATSPEVKPQNSGRPCSNFNKDSIYSEIFNVICSLAELDFTIIVGEDHNQNITKLRQYFIVIFKKCKPSVINIR